MILNKSTKSIKRKAFDIGVNLRDSVLIVNHLQIKLSNALKNNNLNLAEYLADRIINSYHARILAVHRVMTNSGSKSPSLSEYIPKTNSDYLRMVNDLKQIVKNPKKYMATRLDRIYILKADGKSLRPISIPTNINRALQALFHLVLDVYCEHESDNHSYGFRKLLTPLHAIRRA